MINRLVFLIGVLALVVVFYEGVPLLKRAPFISSVPVLGYVVEGRVMRQVRLAKQDLVVLAEKTAAKATAAEQKRQADAARAAAESFRRKMLEAQAAEAIAQADLEKENERNEKRLAEARRACLLDDSDVDDILRER